MTDDAPVTAPPPFVSPIWERLNVAEDGKTSRLLRKWPQLVPVRDFGYIHLVFFFTIGWLLGRSARRQIYRLPGGAERVVNTRCSTVVADVIQELCGLIGVNSEHEQQEFSLYCIVQGDAFTMPLAADEYILDVTTELHKAAQPFYLIFCRSVW